MVVPSSVSISQLSAGQRLTSILAVVSISRRRAVWSRNGTLLASGGTVGGALGLASDGLVWGVIGPLV